MIVDADAGNNQRKIIAFVGGLDLCDGRYDTPRHTLFRTLETVHKDDYHNPTFTVIFKPFRICCLILVNYLTLFFSVRHLSNFSGLVAISWFHEVYTFEFFKPKSRHNWHMPVNQPRVTPLPRRNWFVLAEIQLKAIVENNFIDCGHWTVYITSIHSNLWTVQILDHTLKPKNYIDQMNVTICQARWVSACSLLHENAFWAGFFLFWLGSGVSTFGLSTQIAYLFCLYL